jgi:hypothetical protein
MDDKTKVTEQPACGPTADSSAGEAQPGETMGNCVDEAGEESFPASDPPSYSPITHTGRPKAGPVPPKRRE